MPEIRKYQFIIPLTAEQKAKYDAKRRENGQTSEGCMKRLVLNYIGEDADDKHTDS